MPIEVQRYPDYKFAYIHACGLVTSEQIISYMMAILPMVEEGTYTRELIDTRAIRDFHVSPADMRNIVMRYETLAKQDVSFVSAIVAETDLLFGMGRMAEVFAEAAEYPLRVFRSFQDAASFISLPRVVIRKLAKPTASAVKP